MKATALILQNIEKLFFRISKELKTIGYNSHFNMRNIPNKRFHRNSVYLMSPTIGGGQSWLSSSESQAPRSSLSDAASLSQLDSSGHHLCNEKETSHQLQDQGSTSSQSTAQSYLEVPPVEGSYPHKLSAGYNGTCGKFVEGSLDSVLSGMESVLSLGTPDFVHSSYYQTQTQTQTQTPACMSYSYTDPYFGGILAPCGPQPIIHPQMMGHARVPLPPHPTEDELVYVNPKQYRGILRRRESRAKLEAQNKIVKTRKPYLHESRHRHACKRERGSGGRFLNTKKAEQSQSKFGTNGSLLGAGGTMCNSP